MHAENARRAVLREERRRRDGARRGDRPVAQFCGARLSHVVLSQQQQPEEVQREQEDAAAAAGEGALAQLGSGERRAENCGEAQLPVAPA